MVNSGLEREGGGGRGWIYRAGEREEEREREREGGGGRNRKKGQMTHSHGLLDENILKGTCQVHDIQRVYMDGRQGNVVVVGCLLNVLGTCWCVSGPDLLRQSYVLPHCARSCRSNFLSHPVTVL